MLQHTDTDTDIVEARTLPGREEACQFLASGNRIAQTHDVVSALKVIEETEPHVVVWTFKCPDGIGVTRLLL